MNVEARGLTIENVLKKGIFIIPEYQREYDWDVSEVDEFLEDINNTGQNENYFIGHMVLEGDYSGDKFDVVDGQQRITTITIILCVIRDLFYEKKFENLAIGINENYIYGKTRNNEQYVILENKMPYPVLQKYVQSIPSKKTKVIPIKSGEKRIIKIYDRVKSQFSDLTKVELEIFRDKILDLELIFVAVNQQVDAFTIFETINATGKDLTALDLIKNQIFKLYNKTPGIDEPNDSWKEIKINSESRELKFLNNFWSSRFKKVSNGRIYKEFINEIVKKKVNINNFLESLKEDSALFKKIIYPEKSDWSSNSNEFQIYFSLNAIVNIFNIEVANPILLELLREFKIKKISRSYILKALNVIERYHFINNAINSNRSSGLDTMYAKFSRNIFNAKSKHQKHSEIDKMIKEILSKIPSKDEYLANINEKLYYSSTKTKQKKLVQYVLNKIEFKEQNKNVNFLNLSIEHIYPEKPSAQWGVIKNKELIENIGNLVLLDAGINSKIGNNDYSKKKKIIIRDSKLISTKKVFENNNEWNENSINSRNSEIAEEMYENIWRD